MSAARSLKRLAKLAHAGAWRSIDHFFTARDPSGLTGLAEPNRLLADWWVRLKAADEAVRSDALLLRARNRDLVEWNPYIRQMARLFVSNVVGDIGFQYKPMVRTRGGENRGELAKDVNAKLKAAWLAWFSGRVTLDRRLTGPQFHRQCAWNFFSDGEVFIRLWRGVDYNAHGLALEGIDPDMVDHKFDRPAMEGENEIRMGIEVDRYGRPVAYHVFKSPVQPYTGLARGDRERERIPAADMIHIFNPERMNQTRGLPGIRCDHFTAKMLDGYQESEAVAARVNASKMGFFQTREGADGGEFNAQKDATGKVDPIIMDANPGTLEQLPPGWEFKDWNPSHPSVAFEPFTRGGVRKLAVGGGFSYEAVSGDLQGVTYSSIHQGVLTERDIYRMHQRDQVDWFVTPIHAEWLAQAMLVGVATDGEFGVLLDGRKPRLFLAAKWKPKGWPWVDPRNDSDAAVTRIKWGMGSRTREMDKQGEDFEENLEELGDEEDAADAEGVSIHEDAPGTPAEPTDDTGEPVTNGNGDGKAKGNGGRARNRIRRLLNGGGHR